MSNIVSTVNKGNCSNPRPSCVTWEEWLRPTALPLHAKLCHCEGRSGHEVAKGWNCRVNRATFLNRPRFNALVDRSLCSENQLLSKLYEKLHDAPCRMEFSCQPPSLCARDAHEQRIWLRQPCRRHPAAHSVECNFTSREPHVCPVSPAAQTDKHTAASLGWPTLNSSTRSASRGWCHEAVQHVAAVRLSLSFAAVLLPSVTIALLADIHVGSHVSMPRGPTKHLYWT